jgi:Trypsin-co-occurring domain 1
LEGGAVARYIEFGTDDGERLLVEVEDAEVAAPPGAAKAGLFKQSAGATVASAQTTFEDAVRNVVRRNADALTAAIRDLPRSPDEVELTFGMKATGEVGNLAIAKAGGEASFSVRIAWRPSGG